MNTSEIIPALPGVVKFGIEAAVIAEIAKRYMPLRVADVNDASGFELVRSARIEVKRLRCDVEKRRIELKADALKFGRVVDAEARRLTELLSPIETHLGNQEAIVENEKKRVQLEAIAAKRRIIDERLGALLKIGVMGNPMTIADMPDDVFSRYLEQERVDREAREEQRVAQEAEFKRLAKAEADRIAAERAELDRVREEQAEKQRKIEEDFRQIAEIEFARSEKIRLAEVAERERVEAEERRARNRAKAEAAEETRREQVRLAELQRPEREKLADFAELVENLKVPEIRNEIAKKSIQEVLLVAARGIRHIILVNYMGDLHDGL